MEVSTISPLGDASEVHEDIVDGDLALIVYAPDDAKLPASDDSHVPHSSSQSPDTPFPGFREGDCVSAIPYRVPSIFYPSYTGILESTMASLKEIIRLLHPNIPESLEHFTALANDFLDILARLGMEESELRYLEAFCREVEHLIMQIQSLTIIRSRTSLEDLHHRVSVRREAVDAATDDVQRSSETVQRHTARYLELRAEIDTLNLQIDTLATQIDILQTESTSAVARRSQLEAEFQRESRFIEREQRLLQLRHSSLTVADASLAHASDAYYAAETQHRSLSEIVSHFDDLLARFPF